MTVDYIIHILTVTKDTLEAYKKQKVKKNYDLLKNYDLFYFMFQKIYQNFQINFIINPLK